MQDQKDFLLLNHVFEKWTIDDRVETAIKAESLSKDDLTELVKDMSLENLFLVRRMLDPLMIHLPYDAIQKDPYIRIIFKKSCNKLLSEFIESEFVVEEFFTNKFQNGNSSSGSDTFVQFLKAFSPMNFLNQELILAEKDFDSHKTMVINELINELKNSNFNPFSIFSPKFIYDKDIYFEKFNYISNSFLAENIPNKQMQKNSFDPNLYIYLKKFLL